MSKGSEQMARIVIKPIMPLEIVFQSQEEDEEDVVLTALFNNTAALTYASEFGDIDTTMAYEINNKPYDFASKMLYCGLKSAHPNITLDEAKSIMFCGGESLLIDVLGHIEANFMLRSNEKKKKKFQVELKKKVEEVENLMESSM